MAASWRNRSPGDLSIELPEVHATEVDPVLASAKTVAVSWGRTPLEERCACLKVAQKGLQEAREELALGISIETGKPLTEALGEVGAVIAKIDLTIADAREYLADRPVSDGPQPARVRRCRLRRIRRGWRRTIGLVLESKQFRNSITIATRRGPRLRAPPPELHHGRRTRDPRPRAIATSGDGQA